MRDQDPLPGPADHRLTTKEAAELLGVKPETVYAYVSRGQLSSRRVPGGRGSTFDAKEVEALARRNRRETGGSPGSGGELSVRTRITFIDRDRYYYRGVDATELAARHSYEEIAEWLWTGRMQPGITFTAPDATVDTARRAVEALPEHTGPTDRLRVAAIAAAAADPLRFDLSEEAVLGSARTLIPTLVAALPPVLHDRRSDDGQLAPGCGRGSAAASPTRRPCAPWTPHWVFSSTTTSPPRPSRYASPHRLARTRTRPCPPDSASLRAPCTARPAGSPTSCCSTCSTAATRPRDLGGAAGRPSHPRPRSPSLPGRGPRARALFTLLEEIPRAEPALLAARDIVATTARHAPLHANVDLALAVLTASSGMPATAGETVFAVARTAGWIAHALEEYGERPLRMRPSGTYMGPKPPQPLPEP